MSASKKPPFPKAISKEEINELPLRKYTGKVHVVNSENSLRQALTAVRKEKILGFDTESKPAFKKGESHPPALIQLATGDAVYLFQLTCIKFGKGLRSILSDPQYIKVGVGLDYDIRKLNDLAEFKAAGFVDLAPITDKLGIESNGLRNLAGVVLGFRITKSAQRSNWARKQLSASQIAYAATHAWVSRELYLRVKDAKPTS